MLNINVGNDDHAVTLPDKIPVLRLVSMPADANPNGDVFGGWVQAHIDVAGAIAAVERARCRVVTVAVNGVQFKQPVSVGDLLSFYAEVSHIGRTSITVNVEVYAVRNPYHRQVVKVTEAAMTYVAIDKEGNKQEIPPEK